jgi:hypothetical protein
VTFEHVANGDTSQANGKCRYNRESKKVSLPAARAEFAVLFRHAGLRSFAGSRRLVRSQSKFVVRACALLDPRHARHVRHAITRERVPFAAVSAGRTAPVVCNPK